MYDQWLPQYDSEKSVYMLQDGRLQPADTLDFESIVYAFSMIADEAGRINIDLKTCHR